MVLFEESKEGYLQLCFALSRCPEGRIKHLVAVKESQLQPQCLNLSLLAPDLAGRDLVWFCVEL